MYRCVGEGVRGEGADAAGVRVLQARGGAQRGYQRRRLAYGFDCIILKKYVDIFSVFN